ncbi:MAG: M15 family metallopeptidase [Clostridia bacterium]|nr:M15 family metallopeptidase [Clostridia bacterium]
MINLKALSRRRLTAIAIVAILVISIAIALLVRALTPRVNKDDFRVYFDERITVAYTDTVRNGVVYINAFDLAEYCELTVVGSQDELKLYASEGEYAVFTPDSAIVDIGGVKVNMPAPAYFDKDTLWIPCDFVNTHFIGVSIVIDTELNKLSVWRDTAEGSTSARPIYVSVTFDRTSAPITDLPATDIKQMISSYTFMTNIDKYKKYLDPTDKKYLMLVNKTTLLGDSFSPSPLTAIDSSLVIYGGSKQLEQTAAMALEAMMQEMRAAGYADVYVTSAYRDYAYQSALFSTYINKEMSADATLTYAEARDKVLTYSAEPGSSEHQSGLCVDFITSTMTDLDETFASYPVYRWLCENAHKFGFILRYPADKVDITGYSYEPWHYRFVGQTAAAEMYLSGECLEEYLD